MLKLNGGTLEAGEALENHEAAWQSLLATPELQKVGELLVATTLSWKVANRTTLFDVLESNAAEIEQVHIGTVNDRYIASATLREPFSGLPILKILERRSGSEDPLGLDSVDYLTDDLDGVFTSFHAAGLHIVREHNDMHAWLSLRFGEADEFEAKITDHLVLDVGVKELQLASKQIQQQLKTD